MRNASGEYGEFGALGSASGEYSKCWRVEECQLEVWCGSAR